MAPATPRDDPDDPAALQAEAALAAIEGSAAFRGSRRHRVLLRHLVERARTGRAAELKESVLAVEVFGRHPASFDPRSDAIVRVETRRLRRRLEAYYAGEGRGQPLRIDLPVGSYVPALTPRPASGTAPTATRRARDLVERGEHFLRQPLSQDTLEQALDRFNAALRESPDHAPAWVGAGRALLNLATGWYRDPTEAGDHAIEALHRALALDPSQAVARALFGAAVHLFERDWPAARRHFREAAAAAPDNAFVHSAYGSHLLTRGELQAAERELLLARRLDPHYVNSRMQMVNLRIAQGRLTDASAELDGLRDIAPGAMPLAGLAGLLAVLKGDAASALHHFEQAVVAAPGHPGCVAALAGALGLNGRVAEADALIETLRRRGNERAVSPYVLAIVALRCGRPDEALSLLESVLSTGDPNVIYLASDPSLQALHADPRWPALSAASRRPRRLTPTAAAAGQKQRGRSETVTT